MLNDKRILAVVPARGGSKGIKLKNITLLKGRPLIAWTADVALEVDIIDRLIVSTDSSAIKKTAQELGLDCPFFRPKDISGDFVSDVAVLTHALQFLESRDSIHYDIVLMLQPTSPMRTVEHVNEVLNKLVRGGFDSVLTLSQTDLKFHPLKQLQIADENVHHHDHRGSKIIARQQLAPTYHRNGIAYAVTRQCLLNEKTLIGRNCSFVIIPGRVVNIDYPADIKEAEGLEW
jgi:CMP-N-acetylneuraminic acid synthetase